jgi:hypothetical protein
MGRRSAVAVALAGVGIALLGAAVVAYVMFQRTRVSEPACRVVADGHTYGLDREQAANAITITAAASAVGLPHHAVTIAVAAALQESQLHNLARGDRDSLGLFQQRPSQGWGSADQILNPRLAAESFFRALAGVDHWQTLSVNTAAQRVQRSARPVAYAKWESEARAIARATTGEAPGTLTCKP